MATAHPFRPADTEKVTINLGHVDLGRIGDSVEGEGLAHASAPDPATKKRAISAEASGPAGSV